MMIDHDLQATEQMKSEQRRISWTFSDKKPALDINPLMHTLRLYNGYGKHKGVIGLLKILVREIRAGMFMFRSETQNHN